MKRTVFYSWQSDLPNATNRSFIENALREAAKEISQEIKVEFNSVDMGDLNEDAVISSLFESSSNFQNQSVQLDYDLFPRNADERRWWVADNSYNSNSYTSGLLNSVGLEAPVSDYRTPGYDRPVPIENFRSKEKKESEVDT